MQELTILSPGSEIASQTGVVCSMRANSVYTSRYLRQDKRPSFDSM